MKNTESTKIELVVTPRTEFGKKVKQLRKKGIIPANIYGADYQSQAISVQLKDFTAAHKTSGETGIVYMKVDGKEIPTLIKKIEKHPIDNTVLHVDFRKINLKQKIETEVPVQVEGESTAVNQLAGVLLIQADHLMVEALPANIPSHIIVDISTITELGQEIKVKDLAVSSEYVIKEDAEKVIVSVVEHKEESVEVETTSEAPEITSEKPEGEEGATPTAEGESAPKEKTE